MLGESEAIGNSVDVEPTLNVTKLRMNTNYNFYYENIARLMVLGIIPLFLLSYWNFNIYKHMKSAPNVLGHVINRQERINEEKDLSLVLIGIVFTFFFCHILRIFINFYDAVVWRSVLECKSAGEHYLPSWIIIADNFNHVMLVINSSVNIVIYCCMNSDFRKTVFNLRNSLARVDRP